MGKKHNSQNTTGIILAFSLGCQDLAAAAAAVLAETIKSSLPCNDPLALLKLVGIKKRDWMFAFLITENTLIIAFYMVV